MRSLSKPTGPPTLRHKTERPTGLRFVPKMEQVPGPGDPPDGFLNGQNSLTEWYFYWALAKVFNNPHGNDVRKAPFYGGWPDWSYQTAELGGHVRALGSAVVDFVVYQGMTLIFIRIQTERFHLFADNKKQAYDRLQRATLESNGPYVVDVYDTAILNDPSGQKAVIAAKRAIGRIQDINPDIGRTALRGSRQKVIA